MEAARQSGYSSAAGHGSKTGAAEQLATVRPAPQTIAFEYPDSGAPAALGWQGWDSEPEVAEPEPPPQPSLDVLRAEFEHRLQEETRKAFEAGRERGRQEAHQAVHEAQIAAEAERRRQAAETLTVFVQERDRYFHAVEREVVELALAVAARILRREAQMDPLLLTGAVRVALGQLAESTEVCLRVPPEDLALWTETVARIPNLALKPSVVSGEGMRLGECLIETGLGSVDLGLRAQLGEIERGFFDRVTAQRAPRNSAEAAAPASGSNLSAVHQGQP